VQATHLDRSFLLDIVCPLSAPQIGDRCLLPHERRFFRNDYFDWWDGGPYNYVYTASQRELERLARGNGLSAIVTKPFNDFYEKDSCEDIASTDSTGCTKKVKQIEPHGKPCELSGAPKSRLKYILFLEKPSAVETAFLKRDGSTVSLTRTRLLPLVWAQEIR
jgi:hypothetical protein